MTSNPQNVAADYDQHITDLDFSSGAFLIRVYRVVTAPIIGDGLHHAEDLDKRAFVAELRERFGNGKLVVKILQSTKDDDGKVRQQVAARFLIPAVVKAG